MITWRRKWHFSTYEIYYEILTSKVKSLEVCVKTFLVILTGLDHWWQLIECVGLRKHGLGVVSIISWKVGEIKGSKNTLKSRHDQSEIFELQLFSHFSLSQFIQKIKFSPLAPRITTKKKLSKIGCYSYSTTLKTGNVFLCTEIYYRYRIAPWNSSRFFCFPRWPKHNFYPLINNKPFEIKYFKWLKVV